MLFPSRRPSPTLLIASLLGLTFTFAAAADSTPSEPPASTPSTDGASHPGGWLRSAHGSFFDQQIVVSVTVGPPDFHETQTGGGDDSAGHDGDTGAAGGHSHHMRSGGYGSHGGRHDESGESGAGAGSSGQAPAPHLRPSHGAIKQVHLWLTNHGTTPVEIDVRQFSSAYGSFAVQPNPIKLVPGATKEADPMYSRLEIYDNDAPVTIELYVNGRLEQQVLSLSAPPAAPSS